MYNKIIPPGKTLSSLNKTDWEPSGVLKNQHTFFPRSINITDIDKAVYNWFNEQDIIIPNSDNLPVFFLTPEKWGEFKQQWKYKSDDKTTVNYPYITIRRMQSPRLGQTPLKSRIPGKMFTTYKIPIYANGGTTYKHFRVPQPIKIDLEYEIRCLTHYISDINIINETLLKHFASLQGYLNIDGHYMPMIIDNVSDETETDNVEDERIIHTLYSIMVKGYIIDEKEFQVKNGITKILVNIEETN